MSCGSVGRVRIVTAHSRSPAPDGARLPHQVQFLGRAAATAVDWRPRASMRSGSSSISRSRSRPPAISIEFTPGCGGSRAPRPLQVEAERLQEEGAREGVLEEGLARLPPELLGHVGLDREAADAARELLLETHHPLRELHPHEVHVHVAAELHLDARPTLPGWGGDPFRTPFICWIEASTGEVAKASIVSGELPGHSTFTESCGKLASGRSSRGMFFHAATPGEPRRRRPS
jgi:hypothetical protein